MRKLTLESLQVESFETTAETARWRGTVNGHGIAPATPNCQPSAEVSLCVVCETQAFTRCGTCVYELCTGACSNNCSNGTGCPASCWLPGDTLQAVCHPD